MSDTSSLADLRHPSRDRPLREEDLPAAPMEAFAAWLDEALGAGALEPNAMTLSTVDPAGRPCARTVLLKYYDAEGLVFYTNYESRKARDIAAHPHVSLLFFWPELERQIQVRGAAERVSTAESLRYFARRPRESRVGAWVSHQSAVIQSRALLEAKFAEMTRRFREGEVPLPSFWGGYRVRPTEVELWQGRAHRLHDRFLYSRAGGGWTVARLAP